MTALDLLEQLDHFVREATADLLTPVRVARESGERKIRAPKVYKMRLPSKDDETRQIPYVLLQFIKSTVTWDEGERPRHQATVRIVAATYSEKGDEGAGNTLNLLTRIQLSLLRAGMIADRYILESGLEIIVYPDNVPPYYLGEMITVWTMPPIDTKSPLPGAEYEGRLPVVESEGSETW